MNINELYKIFCHHQVVTTDTRDCPERSIFFALKGVNFDGNAFAKTALERGCAYAVIDDASQSDGSERYIVVENVLQTLQQLANIHRNVLGTPVVQITGTNGKTTTKELTTAVLSERFEVLATIGNLNNHIGVPKTLLRLEPKHEIAVIETGANHPGEIALLSEIVNADCGLITNVGMAHLEGFGSFEGVIRTKGELYDYLRRRDDRFVFLHGDNPHLCGIAKGLESVTYGKVGKGYDVEGEVIACTPFLKLRWRVKDSQWFEVQTHLIGAYNITNALAAAAVGVHFGVSPEQVSHALSEYVPTNSRSELRETAHNRLIVDAYNANPTSMRAALENFALIPDAHKMAIIGEMRELGEASVDEHVSVVRQLAELGLEEVWLVGTNFCQTDAARACYGQSEFKTFANVEDVKSYLATNPVEGRLILIKGSNGTRLFQLPELL